MFPWADLLSGDTTDCLFKVVLVCNSVAKGFCHTVTKVKVYITDIHRRSCMYLQTCSQILVKLLCPLNIWKSPDVETSQPGLNVIDFVIAPFPTPFQDVTLIHVWLSDTITMQRKFEKHWKTIFNIRLSFCVRNKPKKEWFRAFNLHYYILFLTLPILFVW